MKQHCNLCKPAVNGRRNGYHHHSPLPSPFIAQLDHETHRISAFISSSADKVWHKLLSLANRFPPEVTLLIPGHERCTAPLLMLYRIVFSHGLLTCCRARHWRRRKRKAF